VNMYTIDMLLAEGQGKGDIGANSINDDGIAVGNVLNEDGTVQPCIWPANGGTAALINTDVPNVTAMAINSYGAIAGARTLNDGEGYYGVVYDKSGKTDALPNLPDDVDFAAFALGINDSYIIGYSETGVDVQQHATRWAIATHAIEDLGALDGFTDSRATAINSSDQIVGYCSNDDGSGQAFLWTSGGKSGSAKNPQMEGLGTLGGLWSQAYGVNSAGNVVGASVTTAGDVHAFVWRRGANNGAKPNPQMEDLGTLPGQSYSVAKFIDDKGNVFGQSAPNLTGPFIAVISEPSPYRMLDLLAPWGVPPSPVGRPSSIYRSLARTRGYAAMEPLIKRFLRPGDFYPALVGGGNSKGQIVGTGTVGGANPSTVGYRITFAP
jgi:probable HAF family extracellular repeat protein